MAYTSKAAVLAVLAAAAQAQFEYDKCPRPELENWSFETDGCDVLSTAAQIEVR